jgi:hypothetical protein
LKLQRLLCIESIPTFVSVPRSVVAETKFDDTFVYCEKQFCDDGKCKQVHLLRNAWICPEIRELVPCHPYWNLTEETFWSFDHVPLPQPDPNNDIERVKDSKFCKSRYVFKLLQLNKLHNSVLLQSMDYLCNKPLPIGRSSNRSKRWNASITDWLHTRYHESIMSSGTKLGKQFIYHPQVVAGDSSGDHVYIGLCRSDGREVAIKYRAGVFASINDAEAAESEFWGVCCELQKRNIISGLVHYVGGWTNLQEGQATTTLTTYIAFELMEGSLAELLSLGWYDSVDGTHVHQLKATQHVLGSMLVILNDFIMETNIALCNIKPANIMIDVQQRIRYLDMSAFQSELPTFATQKPPTDIYSLGIVFRTMLGPPGELVVPRDWPVYRAYTALQLLGVMLEEDEGKSSFRGYASGVHTVHNLLLAHPFFWSAQKATAFLFVLSCVYRKVPHLTETIRASLTKAGQNWLRILPENFRFYCLKMKEKHQYLFRSQESQTNPDMFMKMIHETLSKMNGPTYPKYLKKALLAQPLFLNIYPHLVCDCWHHLLTELNVVLTLPLLREYIAPFNPRIATMVRAMPQKEVIPVSAKESCWDF